MDGVQEISMALPVVRKPGGELEEARLFVARDHGHAGGYPRNSLGIHLRVAACDQCHGIGIVREGLPDRTTGLLLGLAGDGAGVEDVEVGHLANGGNLGSRREEGVGDGLALQLVELAAEGRKGDAQAGHWRIRSWMRFRPSRASTEFGLRASADS